MAQPRRIFSYLIALVIVVALGAGLYVRIQQEDAAVEDDDGGDRPLVSATQTFSTDVSIPVEGAEVVQDTLILTIQAAGQAVAWRQATIRSQVSALLEEVPIRESDRVRAGQLLARLDSTEFALAVARATAGVRSAEVAYREATLFDDRVDDPEVRAERDRVARAKSNLDQQEVMLREAELNLSRARLTAPFPGRVASVKVVAGQWVNAGDELMTVVDLNPIRVEVQVLESEVAHLAPGRSARVNFAAYPGEFFTGEIETINPVIDPVTRTARVIVTIPNRARNR